MSLPPQTTIIEFQFRNQLLRVLLDKSSNTAVIQRLENDRWVDLYHASPLISDALVDSYYSGFSDGLAAQNYEATHRAAGTT